MLNSKGLGFLIDCNTKKQIFPQQTKGAKKKNELMSLVHDNKTCEKRG